MVKLSKRESEAVELLVECLPIKEIAYRMSVSDHSVKMYLRVAAAKVGVDCRLKLLLWKAKQNFVKEAAAELLECDKIGS